MTKQACEGVKILDFSWAAVAPMSVRYLADHGAMAIHVQSWARPDFIAYQRPRWNDVAHPNMGYWQGIYNASKYSITVNLEKPKAQELIKKRLIQEWQPDIIAESFTPGVMKRLGLDYEGVRELKPDIIYQSTCIQGQYGPHSHFPGYGNLGGSLAGFYYISGWPDGDIAPPYGAYNDFINMRYGGATLLAALDYKRRTGKGMFLDQSQYECSLHFLAPPIMDYTVNGRIFERNANRLPSAAPHGVYPCKGKDRWIAIAIFNDQEWYHMRQVMGNADWTKDAKFATLTGRKENEDELDCLVAQWTTGYAREQVEAMMQTAGVAANVVESTADLFDDPQLGYRRHYRSFQHKAMGPTYFEGPSFKLSKTPDAMWCPATYGEHNEHVFKEMLGMTDEDIADLIAEGVISTEADFFDFIDRMAGKK